MRTEDGQELIVRADGLALPLPVTTVATFYRGITEALESIGYRDVVILTDGPHAGSIAATPPAGGPHDPQDDGEDLDDDPARTTEEAWDDLCQATTALGRAAAHWELARGRYATAAKDHPRSGPPPAEGGAPTAPTT